MVNSSVETFRQCFIDSGIASGIASRRRRTKFTNEQLVILEKTFTHGSKFPSPGERMRLETRTGLSKEKISVWFQNRRAKEKREKTQEENSKETEESTTGSETEDEIQLDVCEGETPEDETVEQESETENKVNQTDQKANIQRQNVGRKRSHIIQDFASSPFENPGEKTNILYLENLREQNNIAEKSSADHGVSFSNICDANKSDVETPVKVIDVTAGYYQSESREDTRLQKKRRKFFHTEPTITTNPGIDQQSYTGLEYRLYGET